MVLRLELRLTVDVVTTVRVTHVQKLIYVQIDLAPLVTPQAVFQEGVRTVRQRTESNVHHGRKTITALKGLALIKDVCPLMGGWGF